MDKSRSQILHTVGSPHAIPGFLIRSLRLVSSWLGTPFSWTDAKFLGPVVRVSPNEVGINNPDDVKVIQKVSGGFRKSAWYDMTGPGMLGMRDRERHSRRRRLLAHPLSNSSLPNFEPLIRAKVDLAMGQMQKESQKLGYANVHKWFSFMATDIIGDLTFGSSFRMLEQGKVSVASLASRALLK